MAKLQGYNYNMDCVMGPKLQRLFYRRARAKYKVYLDIEYVTPLLVAGPKKTDRLVSRFEDSIEELDSHSEGFKLAHQEYVKEE